VTLDDQLAALRAFGDAADDHGGATRIRVRRSLEAAPTIRRQLVSAAVALAILLGGTVSWALVTGNLGKLWSHVRDQAATIIQRELLPQPPQAAPIATAPQRARTVAPPPLTEWTPPPEPAPPPPAPTPAPAPKPTPKPQPAPAPPPKIEAAAPVEALYRAAHDLHFHSEDHTAALAAWDAYLAAEPTGRFAVEARYNRALLLIRLARFADARAALEPFARGDVEPAGYRQREAAMLIERIDRSGSRH